MDAVGPIKILVVDDSALFRGQVKTALSGPEFQVVGSAGNGQEALAFLQRQMVDLVVLDVEMPLMDGKQTTQEIAAKNYPCKVILFSGIGKGSAAKTLEALRLGATDFVAKPVVDPASTLTPAQRIGEILVPKIKSIFGRATAARPKTSVASRSPGNVIWEALRPQALVIASSTGGPTALESLLADLKFRIPFPIFIVQHMPATFTTSLAERLERISGKICKEAVDGEEVLPDRIYLAPGNYHMELVSLGGHVQIRVHQEAMINFVRPAADPLFKTASHIYGRHLVGMVLTGMGHDGQAGCHDIKEKRGVVLIQSKETCVVFGMPGAVFESGDYDFIGNIENLRSKIKTLSGAGGKTHAA